MRRAVCELQGIGGRTMMNRDVLATFAGSDSGGGGWYKRLRVRAPAKAPSQHSLIEQPLCESVSSLYTESYKACICTHDSVASRYPKIQQGRWTCPVGVRMLRGEADVLTPRKVLHQNQDLAG